jgi:hypothetical protein
LLPETIDAAAFYRHAFLRHAPRRYAVMQPQHHFEQTGEKYHDERGQLTDEQISLILSGTTAFAVPYAENGLAHLLALDVDCDHLDDPQAPFRALRDELARRHLWHFAQYDPARRRGYVWIPFDDLVNAARLAALGDQVIAAISQPGWKIENRATNEDTRLPLCRHTWTGIYGLLLLDERQIDIDANPAGALAQLASSYHENSTDQLPPPPAPAPARSSTSRPASQGMTIAHFNAENDLADLLISYNAKRAGQRLYLCPFHDDQHPSLVIWQNRAGITVCQCKSQHSACPLAERPGCDAFYVYCTGENLTPQQALRRLNGRSDDPKPKPGPQTPPAAPGPATPGRGEYHATPPPTHRIAPHHVVLFTQHQTSTTSTPQRPTQATRPTEARRTPTEHPELPKSARYILAEITGQPTGYIYGKNRLATTLDIDPSTVRRNLRLLEQRGLIRTEQRGLGHTDVYHAVGGGHLPPTWNHEISTRIKPDLASRGGQPQAQAASDQAESPPALAESDQAEPALVCTQTRICVHSPNDQPANLAPVEQLVGSHGAAQAGGASYEPSAERDDPSGPGQRAWRATLRPSELYAVLYAEQDMYERWQCAADQQIEAPGQVTQCARSSFGQAELGDELGDVPRQAEQPPAPACRLRVVPTEPAQRAKYYKFLGAAKKAKSDGQARRLRELAAALLVEVDDDQAEELPQPLPQRTIARTPHALRLGGRSIRAPLPPPTSSSGPDLGPELDPAGWRFEWYGSGLRAVHCDGWATHSYQADRPSIRGHIERREYHRIEGAGGDRA